MKKSMKWLKNLFRRKHSSQSAVSSQPAKKAEPELEFIVQSNKTGKYVHSILSNGRKVLVDDRAAAKVWNSLPDLHESFGPNGVPGKHYTILKK